MGKNFIFWGFLLAFFLIFKSPVYAGCSYSNCSSSICFGSNSSCDCNGNSCQWRSGCNNGSETVCNSTCDSQQEARDDACGGGGGPGPGPSCTDLGGGCTGPDFWEGVGSCGGHDNCSGICDCGCGSGCGNGNSDTSCNYDAGENRCDTSKKRTCGSRTSAATCGSGCTWYSTSVCGPGQTCTGTYPNGTCNNICGGGIACVPPCSPQSCAAQGKNCGSISDGCGTNLNCGTCPSPQVCGAVTPNVCCIPTTCAAAGKNCGQMSDGCGATLNCGACTLPQTCGGGGGANVCGFPAWFQTAGGDVHVNKRLGTTIPATCGTICSIFNSGLSFVKKILQIKI